MDKHCDYTLVAISQDWLAEELGKYLDNATLMNSRLVCQLWNSEFLKTLEKRNQKKGHAVFVQRCGSETVHDFKTRMKSQSRNLSTVARDSKNTNFCKSVKIIDNIRISADFAEYALCGLENLVTILLMETPTLDAVMVQNLFTRMTPTTKKLYISEVETNPQSNTSRQFHIESLKSTDLRSFSFKLALFQDNMWGNVFDHEHTSRIVKMICKSAPELKHLNTPYFQVVSKNVFDNLDNDLDFPAMLNLEHLVLSCNSYGNGHVIGYPFKQLNKNASNWKLRVLSLTNLKGNHSEGLTLLLENVSHTLEKLTLQANEVSINSTELRIPDMPKLKEFRMICHHALSLTTLSDIVKLSNLNTYVHGCNTHPYDCASGRINGASCIERLLNNVSVTSKLKDTKIKNLHLIGFVNSSAHDIQKLYQIFPNLQFLEIGINNNNPDGEMKKLFYSQVFRALAKNVKLRLLVLNLSFPAWFQFQHGSNEIPIQQELFGFLNKLNHLQKIIIEIDEIEDISDALLQLPRLSHVVLIGKKINQGIFEYMRQKLSNEDIFMEHSSNTLFRTRKDIGEPDHDEF